MAKEFAVIGDKVFMEETVAGGVNERKVVDRIVALFRDYVDWVSFVDTPVDTWLEEECIVYSDNGVYECRSLPYTMDVKVVAKPVLIENTAVDAVRGRIDSSSIIFTRFPKEIDLAKFIVYELSGLENVEAIVFYDEEPGLFRRVVVNFSPFYSFKTGSPNPIPVVSMKREDVYRILKGSRRVELEVKAKLKKGSTGRTVLLGLNGKGEREIHVTAHHDHWFSGVSDNLIGLEILYRLVKKIRGGWSGLNLVIASFTAEEFGAPGFVSWYWAWGSRFYLSILDKKGSIDLIHANVNVDALLEEPVEVYYNPSLRKCVEKLGFNVIAKPYDHMDFDSFSYSIMGVPSVNLTTIDALKPIYHSNLDNGSKLNPSIVESVSTMINGLLDCLSMVNVSYGDLVNSLIEVFGNNVPLEVKNLVHKIATLDADLSDFEKTRIIGRLFTKATYTVGLNQIHISGLLSDLILLKNIYENINDHIGRRLVIMSFDENVLSVDIRGRGLEHIREVLRGTMINRALNYIEVLEKEYILYRTLRSNPR